MGLGLPALSDPTATAFVAGLLAAVACGLGALPAFLLDFRSSRAVGRAHAFAAGLMVAAAVLALVGPGVHLAVRGDQPVRGLLGLAVGAGLGAVLIPLLRSCLPRGGDMTLTARLGGRNALLVFVVMTLHSVPEGIAVGAGYGAGGHGQSLDGLGHLLAVVIAVHNVPEGLVVALPMRAGGASLRTCFVAAFLTSLPQAVAAAPACLAVSVFEPVVLPSLGFAAGAMLYLVAAELVPEARAHCGRADVVGWFAGGTVIAAPLVVL